MKKRTKKLLTLFTCSSLAATMCIPGIAFAGSTQTSVHTLEVDEDYDDDDTGLSDEEEIDEGDIDTSEDTDYDSEGDDGDVDYDSGDESDEEDEEDVDDTSNDTSGQGNDGTSEGTNKDGDDEVIDDEDYTDNEDYDEDAEDSDEDEDDPAEYVDEEGVYLFTGESFAIDLSEMDPEYVDLTGTWEVDDEEIASVSGDVITALDVGYAEVYGIFYNEYGDVFDITISVYVCSPNQTSTDISLNAGGKTRLPISGLNEDYAMVSYASADTSIATIGTVDSGMFDSYVVKGIAPGNTTLSITFTSSTGVTKSFSYNVSVAKAQAAKAVKVPKKLTVKKGTKKAIAVKNVPSGTKVTYKSKNKKVATVNKKGIVKGKKKGKTKIIVKVGKKTYKVNVKVK